MSRTYLVHYKNPNKRRSTMGRPKKEADKKISYKFSKKNGGEVTFKGLQDEEKLPEELTAIMTKYGFIEDGGWVDGVAPSGDDLEDDMRAMANLGLPVSVSISLKVGKRKSTPEFTVEVEDCELCVGKTAQDALLKAHKAWNKAERPIDGAPFTGELDAALNIINKDR